jgi:hypothetical protein
MSGHRASRRKRIRGELIGTHCSTCGEPLMFVSRDHAWNLNSDVVCPSCAHLPHDQHEAPQIDRAAIALRVLLIASCLKTAAELGNSDHRCALVEGCRNVVEELTHLSAQIGHPTKDLAR